GPGLPPRPVGPPREEYLARYGRRDRQPRAPRRGAARRWQAGRGDESWADAPLASPPSFLTAGRQLTFTADLQGTTHRRGSCHMRDVRISHRLASTGPVCRSFNSRPLALALAMAESRDRCGASFVRSRGNWRRRTATVD